MEFDRRKIPSYFMIMTIVAIVIFFNISYFRNYISANNEQIADYALSDEDINPVRESAVAGLFYPADVYQLDKELDGYLEHVSPEQSGRPRIMIVPHAGYKYSAQVAAHAYKKLRPFKNKIKKVFLLGPSHHVFVKGVALSPAKQFKTPLGVINTDESITAELKQHDLFKMDGKAHKKEHALEVQMPFLQKTLENFTIIPMLYGEADPEMIAAALYPYLKEDNAVLIVSADLSHYLDYDTAKIVDAQTAEQIGQSLDINHHQSCGATAVNTAVKLARAFGLTPQLLDMANSGDTGTDKTRGVGYGAWAYQEPEDDPVLSKLEQEQKHLQNFARHHKASLLEIVKKSLEHAVLRKPPYRPERKNFNDVLFDKGASFVTLHKNGNLRGCIGSLLPVKAIAADLADNAYSAAMQDKRFSPVKPREFKDITFTISLLTNFEQINFNSYEDLLSKIQPEVDGLFLQDGKREGVFLPAVWKELPDKHEFITQLKIKAGLSPTYWSDKIKFFRFRTVEIQNDNN